MLHKAIIYGGKIWLTSVSIGSLIFLILFIKDRGFWDQNVIDIVGNLIEWYIIIVLLELLLSFVIYLVFVGVITIAMMIKNHPLLRKSIILLSGIVLTTSTFLIFFGSIKQLEFLVIALPNCAGIGIGTFLYKLEVPINKSIN